MTKKTIASIRNVGQVATVYQKLGKQGKGDDPYILEYETGGRLLIFYGSRHSNDPKDKQWTELEARWWRFINHENSQKVVLYEQGPLEANSLTREQKLLQNGESGLAVWLAAQAGVPAEWSEPDRVKEVLHLKKQGYDDADIMSYYFARQMLQWVTRDYRTADDWRAYGENCVRSYNSLGCWDEPLTLEKALDWFKRAAGKAFDIKDSKTMYQLSDPSQSKVSAASGLCRNETLLETITSRLESGSDIFVVYGSGHAIALEPALTELTEL